MSCKVIGLQQWKGKQGEGISRTANHGSLSKVTELSVEQGFTYVKPGGGEHARWVCNECRSPWGVNGMPVGLETCWSRTNSR